VVTSPAVPDGRPLPLWARIADVVTLVLFALTLWAVLFGGLRFWVGETRVSVTGAWRPLLEAAAVFALRHAFCRDPTLFDRIRRLPERVPHFGPTIATVVPLFLATRLTVLLVGLVAVETIGYPRVSPPLRFAESELTNLPVRWDTAWYVSIADGGYRPRPSVEDQQNLNFFPAFPMLMRAAGVLLAPALRQREARLAWSGVLVALVASFWALVYLYRSTRERFGHDAAAAALTFLATYPFAIFYSAAYSEGVFLLGAVGAFVHARRGELLSASAWGLLVGLVRPNGCLLSLPLAVLAITGPHGGTPRPDGTVVWNSRRLRAFLAVASAATPVLGMLLYSLFNYRVTGHPFFWAELQQVAWGRTPTGPYESLVGPFEGLFELGLLEYLMQFPYDAFHLLAAIFATASIWPVMRRIGVPEGLFVAINVFVPLFNGSLISMGRFTSVLFPTFVWLGLAVPPQYRALVAALFAMGQGVVAAHFFTWRGFF
jgi:hypothetical protein